jgi:hypothetical protein
MATMRDRVEDLPLPRQPLVCRFSERERSGYDSVEVCEVEMFGLARAAAVRKRGIERSVLGRAPHQRVSRSWGMTGLAPLGDLQ